MSGPTRGRSALFLDRDGVVNEPVWREQDGVYESPLRRGDVELVPGVADAVGRARAAGLLVVIASNQPAAAKGSVSLDQLQAVHEEVLAKLANAGAPVGASYVCWHHPAGVVAGLAGPCDCRKPQPGLLLRAGRELGLTLASSWMVGDTDADVGAARAAGLAGVALVMNPRSAHRRGQVSGGTDISAADTPTAVALVLARRIADHAAESQS